MMRLEETVDVAKSRRTRRHAIFQDQEAPLSRASGEHGRANGQQMLLARIGVNIHARERVEDLSRVIGRDICNRLSVEDRNRTRCLWAPVTIGCDRCQNAVGLFRTKGRTGICR